MIFQIVFCQVQIKSLDARNWDGHSSHVPPFVYLFLLTLPAWGLRIWIGDAAVIKKLTAMPSSSAVWLASVCQETLWS